MEPDRLLSLRQCQELIGLSSSSLSRLRKAGLFAKELRLGRRAFVSLSAYNEWVKKNTVSCTEEKMQPVIKR